jgi:hypothetical protein
MSYQDKVLSVRSSDFTGESFREFWNQNSLNLVIASKLEDLEEIQFFTSIEIQYRFILV